MHLSVAQSLVKGFHERISVPVATDMHTLTSDESLAKEISTTLRNLVDRCSSSISPASALTVRLGLALEELAEWVEANQAGDIVAAADALADRLYVLLGDAVSVGVPIEPVFLAVHESNMSKAANRSDKNSGKGVKTHEYRAPELSEVLLATKSEQDSDSN